MKRLTCLLVAAGLAFACSKDSMSVDPDAIDGRELAAVRSALDSALKDDSSYQILRVFVFAYVDRASRLPTGGGDTMRLVGVQLDIHATKADTPVVAQLSAVLGWRGYSAATRTVDSVMFVVGTGVTPPVSDTLRQRFSPDTAGIGTGFVIHQAPDSSVHAWLARAGALHITASSYGSGTSTSGAGLTITSSRGSVSGDYHVTAKLVPDSSSTVSAAAAFGGGIRGLQIRITGTL
ncbi:MAG: hypothetical protein AUH78_05070 [Gemmatimonadetes bacterium 13_1_40CM_4_69_8]|nr:MAG: hypothetical protein AUH78_05070 [Gemmatimonadetes bacterium 13_1_40CM_4_69_8]